VKLFHFWLAVTGIVSLCACTGTPVPTAPSAITAVGALAATDGFEPIFYRAFVQNGYDAPTQLEAKRVLQAPLRVYLRTQDEAGREIDQATLDATQRTLSESAWIWSGGTFGVVEVERGTRTREQVPGWITVKWSSASNTAQCGRSTVGIDGGFIEFNASGACNCGGRTLVYPRLVRHEMGHAMGYYHTDLPSDVMYGRAITPDACDVTPSDRERRHAKFAHADLR
jgi:hypothetical protein